MGLRFRAGVRRIFRFAMIALLPMAFVVACSAPNLKGLSDKTPCGVGRAPEALHGIFWILGTPASEHFVCTAQDNQYRTVMTLAPESRDPLLLNDLFSGQKILIERFSGRLAKPSRATFLGPQGDFIVQHGDWPQNASNVHRLSEHQGLVVGFDFAELREFQWSADQPLRGGTLDGSPRFTGNSNPSLILRKGTWIGLLDGGFDLVQFKPRTAVLNVLQEGGTAESVLAGQSLMDEKTGMACINAYQTLKLGPAQAVVSCNPQYFGPVAGERVAVFFLELDDSGKLSSRLLMSRSADDIQRIDLMGHSGNRKEVFVTLKKTSMDDYEGRVADASWLNVENGNVASDLRAVGAVSPSSQGQSLIFACQVDSEFCRKGEVAVQEASGGEFRNYAPQFAVPFFSFAAEVPAP